MRARFADGFACVDDDDPFEDPADRLAPPADVRRYRQRAYKPGTRQPVRKVATQPQLQHSDVPPSWWLSPDADYPAEAHRMRVAGNMRIPSENRIVGWEGVW